MQKLTKKKHLLLYGCSALGVNMMNLMVGSYLCSALLTGGFGEHLESWTYLGVDLVIPAIWSILIVASKVLDGLIDLPFASFTDRLKTRWGRRRPSLLIGFVPMLIAYLLFLIPINPHASLANTFWFGGLLCVFYAFYTLTMLTFYATFAEVCGNESDMLFLSNVKSVCDVIYFSLGYALIPDADGIPTERGLTLRESLSCSFRNKSFIFWMLTASVTDIGLQLFLGGINELFSSTGLNMTVVMASSFAPVPFTILLYNKIVKKYGLGIGYRYVLTIFSVGMMIMYICNINSHRLTELQLTLVALLGGILVSFAIGAFFSVTYTVPSHLARLEYEASGKSVSSMYFAVDGLFEGIAAGIATGPILVFLKGTQGNTRISWLPIVVAGACMTAFLMSLLFPKSISGMGKTEDPAAE